MQFLWCTTKERKRRFFPRNCPSPDLINEYLSAISNEPSTLTSVSTICLSCYKYFQSIVSQVAKGEQIPVQPIKDINTIFASLSEQIESIRLKGTNIESNELYEMVMCLNARELAKTMSADEAMLLPTLY